jgi:hypothetical protein
MHAAVRPYVTAGAALVGASVIAITPIARPTDTHIANLAMRLAADSIANIPANLIDAIANIPANEIQGIQEFAQAMGPVASGGAGSWWVVTPTNVLGWDPANPTMLKTFVNMLVPFPALSVPLGDQLNVIAAAELPMSAGCSELTATGCPNPLGILSKMFTVPLWQFFTPPGYTFPTVINPIDGQPVAWSGQTFLLDPLATISSVVNSLMAPPSGIKTVSPQQVVTSLTNLFASLNVAFNPFVPGTACTICQPFVPSSTTSIPSLTPGFSQMLTIKAPPVAPGGAVANAEAKNNVVAGTPTNGPSNASGVSDTVSKTVAPDAGQGLDTATTAIEKPEPTTSTSTNVMSDGKKVEPGPISGGNTTSRSGLATAAKAVRDQVSSKLSKVGNGPKAATNSTAKKGSKG